MLISTCHGLYVVHVHCFHLGSGATIPTEKLLKISLQTASFYLPQNCSKLHCSLRAGFVRLACAAVPGRDRKLFHFVLRLRYRIGSAVMQDFHYGWGSYALCKLVNTWHICTARMSPTPNGSSVLRFKHSCALEIRNGIMFDFYPGLPHVNLIIAQLALCDSHVNLIIAQLALWDSHVNLIIAQLALCDSHVNLLLLSWLCATHMWI